MVSGFLTSPLDQARMASGEATEMATYSTWLTFSRPSNSRADSLVFMWRLFQCPQGGGLSGGGLFHRVGVSDFDIHGQGLHFLDQNVERFRHAGFQGVVPFDNALVNPSAALDVVRLDGEQFLQAIGGAVGLHRPNFHFAEALAAVLRLAPQRL